MVNGSVLAGTAKERAQLVVVHSDNTPPLSFIGLNGEPKGLVIDYWKAWSVKTGIPVKIVQAKWPETLEMVSDGRADIHGGLYQNEERDAYLDFADPFITFEAAIYVRSTLPIANMNEMGGIHVAVLRKGYSEYYLQNNYPHLRRKAYDNSNLMVEAAILGEVDALLTENTTLVHHLGSRGMLEDFKPLKIMYKRELRGAVAKGNDRLLQEVKRGEFLLSDRDRERVFSHWVVLPSPTSGWLVIALIAGFLVLLGAALFALFPLGK